MKWMMNEMKYYTKRIYKNLKKKKKHTCILTNFKKRYDKKMIVNYYYKKPNNKPNESKQIIYHYNRDILYERNGIDLFCEVLHKAQFGQLMSRLFKILTWKLLQTTLPQETVPFRSTRYTMLSENMKISLATHRSGPTVTADDIVKSWFSCRFSVGIRLVSPKSNNSHESNSDFTIRANAMRSIQE